MKENEMSPAMKQGAQQAITKYLVNNQNVQGKEPEAEGK